MKEISLKPLIRRFVLATSFPPFLQIYRASYTLVIRITVSMFKKYPAIKAAYLRRGGGKGEISPLIGDIDFVVIGKRTDEEDKKKLHYAYKELARTTTLLDQSFEVFNCI